MRSKRIPKIIMEWNAEDRRRKEKPKEQWMDEVRIDQQIPQKLMQRQVFMAEQNFF